MIKGIAHAAFNVKDMEKALYFYCDTLGFQRAFEINDDEEKPWIVYIKIREGQFIELFYGGENNPENVLKPIGFSHLCFEVEDIYGIARLLENKGVTLDVKPKQGKDLNYQCWAKDPDGNRIEFMQINKESLQANS